MTPLSLATWLALLGALGAAGLAGLAVLRREHEAWANRALVAASGLTALPLLLLAVDLLQGDLGTFYVWKHTRLDYPWWLRLAGLWGGQQGTFLLWGAIVLGAGWIEARRGSREALWPYARVVLTVLAAVLLVPPVLLGLGQATAEMGLTAAGTFEKGVAGPHPTDLRPQGEGLDPLLESPYMAIHPPVEFLAYGLTAMVFAYALVGLARGGPWREPADRWARPAWLAFATALSLGALWAYLVLSFGGYWAWDPVEVADLLPLLALTILLHASVVHKRTGHLGKLAPAMGAFAFVLVVFATFITRSGLWSSVHAFLPLGTSIAIEDPGARLVQIVSEDVPARYTTGLMLAVGGAFSGAAAAYQARTAPAGWKRHSLWGLAGAYGLVGLAGLLAPGFVAGLLHRLALLLSPGRLDVLVGIVGLLVLAAVPLLVALSRSPEDTPLTARHRNGQLVLASYLLTLILLTTLLLVVLGVNGYDREIFDARAPYLAAATLALVALAFLPGSWTRRAGWTGAAVAVGVAVKLATGSWAWAAAPLSLVALAGPGMSYVRKAQPTGGHREQVRAGLLVASGLLGLVHWASPGHVVLAGLSLSSPAWYVPLGLVAALVAVLAPVLERRGLPRWLGPVAGVASLGYGLGALLALGGWLASRGPARGPGASPRQVGIELVHVAIAILVLGVALSTYGQAITTFRETEPLERGVPQEVQGYTLELVDGRVVPSEIHGGPGVVEATVHVSKRGVFVEEKTLRLEHSFNTGFTGRGSYVPHDSPTVRGWSGDVQLDAEPSVPLSIRLRSAGNTTWITANAPPPAGEAPGAVDAVSLGVATTPGINLVWGALPLLVTGVALRVRR